MNLTDLKLQNINDIDLHGENMDSTINIHMSWKDSRLSWDPSLYGDIRSIHLSPELIWHPIFSIVNRLNEFSPLDERFNQAEIDNEGNVASYWLSTIVRVNFGIRNSLFCSI